MNVIYMIIFTFTAFEAFLSICKYHISKCKFGSREQQEITPLKFLAENRFLSLVIVWKEFLINELPERY